MTYRPAPRFVGLGDGFSDVVRAASFPKRVLRFRNQRWAERIGLGDLDAAAWERHFALFEPLPANLEAPLALRYHGHQFGVYNPMLGDGRGFLFAQVLAADDRLLDLGTKGSGQTPWSRGGDGRLTLKGGVREVLATEMLEALGVYTSKTFSLFETGEALARGDEPSPTRSSVLVRLSHSHVRFGSFQRLAYAKDAERMKRLLAFSVENYLPEIARDTGDLPAAFLAAVTRRSAELCASWMAAGFVHGVLNTDNMNITGESFDYGPFRFLPTYDPAFVAAYFDHAGRYAFGRQPSAVLWSLTRLAEALRTVAPEAAFAPVLREFEPALQAAVRGRVLARLGLTARDVDEDDDLVAAVFSFLEDVAIPFERLFFDWSGGAGTREAEARAMRSPVADAYASDRFVALRAALARYSASDPARLDLPYFSGTAPCTLLIDEVESIWDAIAARDDWAPFDEKIAAIRAMGAALKT